MHDVHNPQGFSENRTLKTMNHRFLDLVLALAGRSLLPASAIEPG
jgi:hypothetical protein